MTHYIIGGGMHDGYLYDYGPQAYDNLQDAVADLADLYELGSNRQRILRNERHLELNPRDGAQYCEITECTCAEPWMHCEDGKPEDWPDYTTEVSDNEA